MTLIVLVSMMLLSSAPAGASGISIAPLEYKSNLAGQIKKGVVDISNTSGYAQQVTMQVRAFRQIDSKGTLQFYENPIIAAGIIPDFQQFQLKPGETIHLFFQLNGQNLPKKQIFAALLAQAQPVQNSNNITPVLRVGTLLILKNGNGGPPKQGQISNLDIPFLQLGNGIAGSFSFKNTEKGDKASGYFPKFTVSAAGQMDSFDGDLVFPGIERQQNFDLSGSHIGIYRLSLTSDANTHAEQWMIVLTGFWRWLLPVIIAAVVGLVVFVIKIVRLSRRRGRRRT